MNGFAKLGLVTFAMSGSFRENIINIAKIRMKIENFQNTNGDGLFFVVVGIDSNLVGMVPIERFTILLCFSMVDEIIFFFFSMPG